MQSNNMQMDAKSEQKEMEAGVASPHAPPNKGDEKTMIKSAGLEVAIMLPPPPALMSLVAAAAAAAASGDNIKPPSSLAASDKDEDEGLSLQVLSARSSTPYTVQGICCANANCELGATDSTTVSPVKEKQTLLMSENKENVIIGQHAITDNDKHSYLKDQLDERKKYSRTDLFDIRDEMTIVKPECLESARLQRLHFRKSDNGSTNGSGNNRNKSYRSSNPPNDLMPAFFKRKAAIANGNNSTSFMYDNFKYTDSHSFNHHNDSGSSSNNSYRRIGSGRISNRDINWDYIPEEDPHKNNLPEFFNTKDTRGIPPKPHRQHKKLEFEDSSNYVKRGMNSINGESSFRSGGSRHSINSSGEERYNSNNSSSTNNTKSDEPEWFSCGPTSRLDTIELCGFNDSDSQKIRLELSKNKPDSNNNREDFVGGHKEKRNLAFQFDDFSTSHNSKSNNGTGSTAASKTPSSKFMPLFNAKKRDDDALSNHNSNQSLNDFFKRNDMPPSVGLQKEKLSLTEIPSVDEIEAKWMNPQLTNDSRNKTSSENLSTENFKKMLYQLNQQQAGAGTVSSPPPQQQQYHQQGNNNNQQSNSNPFSTDNLSNFIKNRNLQQQILQKQQQQAAFAQLQLNTILSRPDTQMLLLSLARGEISKHGLVIQLANPNLSQFDREAISAVLTFSAAGHYNQHFGMNNNQQQHQQLFANQLQNLALMQHINKSPVGKKNQNMGNGIGYQANGGGGGGSTGNNTRTYTQEELQSHANYILHNAMLKKKIEEQNMGLQKMLHLQTSMMNNNINMNNSRAGNDYMAGNKNFQHQQHQQHQQQQHQQNNNHYNKQQHHRRTPNGNRSNAMGRRRSTSSSSSNATVNSGNVGAHSHMNADTHFRRQFEQRRNTIATATVDDFVQIPQRI